MDFHDGNISLGTAQLDDAGVAKLRTNTLSSGAHSLTATYEGDAKFSGSTSAPVAINIVAADFSFLVDHSTATVAAGQSTQFVLTVTPSGGFAGNVTFSCSPVTGIVHCRTAHADSQQPLCDHVSNRDRVGQLSKP